MKEYILDKWKVLIDACKSYYIDSQPTGLSDIEYDELEKRALEEDNFSVRDYIFQTYLRGTKAKNSYIEKIKKEKVLGMTMKQAVINAQAEYGDQIYVDLKYDGSSLAIYLDPTTGTPKRIVTCGNLNLEDFGVDQTYKLMHFLPKKFPTGIVAIQAEALIDLTRLETDQERARQKANGLINSKYCDEEVNNLLTLRAYRYYTDNSPDGISISSMDYRDVVQSFGTTLSPVDGHIMFAPADIFTVDELKEWCEKDTITTSTGTFLADGMVLYNKSGKCIKALKFAGAGSSSDGKVKTKVLDILWNDKTAAGKDSWSANVLVDPIVLRGTEIRKPSAGSVGKLIKNNITPGAVVSIILANSTIPTVSEVFSGGNGDYKFPVCSCGYQLSGADFYGSNLKCGNPLCKKRMDRMTKTVRAEADIFHLDLNKFLVIDRFKWQETNIDTVALIHFVIQDNEVAYHDTLMSYMKTDLQQRNMELVCHASYLVLRNVCKERNLY